jgi:hypothetical protein
MDTSKYYIKMCQKADEVQAFWQPKNGDYFYGIPQDFSDFEQIPHVHQFFLCEDEFYSIIPSAYQSQTKEFIDETDAVRLPSQSDLQAMLQYELPLDLIKDFADWAASLSISEQERHRTMEQLWLGFVMYANYAKKWSGRDWVEL